jgi:DNA-binding transcriptional MerR regulator
LRIGEVAGQVGMTAKAIRYYEALGLLDPPRRTPKGYRVYDPAVVGQLQFIRRAKVLGLSLDEIKRLSETARSGDSTALRAQVVNVLDEKLDGYQQKIAELAERRSALKERRQLAVLATTASSCACHGFASDCPCLPVGAEETMAPLSSARAEDP